MPLLPIATTTSAPWTTTDLPDDWKIPSVLQPIGQRLEVARRAFRAFRLDAEDGVGTDDGPVWSVDTDHPSCLVGRWPVQVEKYSQHPPEFEEDVLEFELAFLEGTALLEQVTVVRENSGGTAGSIPHDFVADERRRAIEHEGQVLRQAMHPIPPVVDGTVQPRRPRL